MDQLKSRFLNAKSDKERDIVREEIRKACDEDAQMVAEITIEQIMETHAELRASRIKEQMEEIIPAISMSYIAKTYFNKTRQWLYQRFNGSIVNGKPAKFTLEEIEPLNFALQDLGSKLMGTRIS